MAPYNDHYECEQCRMFHNIIYCVSYHNAIIIVTIILLIFFLSLASHPFKYMYIHH